MFKVIIADDEMKVCQLIRELLDWDALGLKVAGVANDGLSALDMVKELEPDFLITDIRMPGVDGIELIRRAKELRPDLQCVIISGYRHFDYAHNAIRYGVEDYLLKPINREEFELTLKKLVDKKNRQTREQIENEQLKQQATDRQESLRAEFVVKLLHPDPRAGQGISPEPYLAELFSSIPENGCLCAIIKPDLGGVSPGDRLFDLASEKALAQAKQRLAPLFPLFLAAKAQEGVLCVLHPGIKTPEEASALIRDWMEELLPLRALFPSMEVTVGLSQPANKKDLPAAMQKAYEAVCERLKTGAGKVIVYTQKAPWPGFMEAVLTTDIRKGLLAALEILDENGYKEQLDKALNAFAKASRLTAVNVYEGMRELICLHFLKLNGRVNTEETLERFQQDFYEAWNCASTMSNAEDALKRMLTGHLNAINRERGEQEMRPIRLAKKYMQENYHKPITLEDVSAVAGFHPTYFSTVFKKITGENFLEYLSELRMKEAKELLSDNRLNIADIAEMVGYADGKYFVKLFKKSTGLTPQEYRKLYY